MDKKRHRNTETLENSKEFNWPVSKDSKKNKGKRFKGSQKYVCNNNRMHIRNAHREYVNYNDLCKIYSSLMKHIYQNRYGGWSISYSDPFALYELTKALMHYHYGIVWFLPTYEQANGTNFNILACCNANNVNETYPDNEIQSRTKFLPLDCNLSFSEKVNGLFSPSFSSDTLSELLTASRLTSTSSFSFDLNLSSSSYLPSSAPFSTTIKPISTLCSLGSSSCTLSNEMFLLPCLPSRANYIHCVADILIELIQEMIETSAYTNTMSSYNNKFLSNNYKSNNMRTNFDKVKNGNEGSITKKNLGCISKTSDIITVASCSSVLCSSSVCSPITSLPTLNFSLSFPLSDRRNKSSINFHLSKTNELLKKYLSKLTLYDIGVGANCIYPLIGVCTYTFNFVCSDINLVSIHFANMIVSANNLQNKIKIFHQINKLCYFDNVIDNTYFFFESNNLHFKAQKGERSGINIKQICQQDKKTYQYSDGQSYDKNEEKRKKEEKQKLKKMLYGCCVCNPPFHSHVSELNKNPTKNTFGYDNEILCEGGELEFIKRMIKESEKYGDRFIFFSCLVGKKRTLKNIRSFVKDSHLMLYSGNKMHVKNKNIDNEIGRDCVDAQFNKYFERQRNTETSSSDEKSGYLRSSEIGEVKLGKKIKNFKEIPLYQGKQTRWILCWTFLDKLQQIQLLRDILF